MTAHSKAEYIPQPLSTSFIMLLCAELTDSVYGNQLHDIKAFESKHSHIK